MTEPSIAFVGLTATGGITILGAATGLQPDLIIAGLIGALWAQQSKDKVSTITALSHISIAGLVGAIFTPVLIELSIWSAAQQNIGGEHLTAASLGLLISACTAFLCNSGILATTIKKLFDKGVTKITGEEK